MSDPFEPGLLRRIEPPRKVVVLKASRIGDFLCAQPALCRIRHALPGAEITLITLPMLRELAEHYPYIDQIVPFPGYPGIAEQLFDPRRALRLFSDLQDEGFDLAVQLQGSGANSNPFMLMLGARYTAGFIRRGDPPGLLSAALPLPEQGHEVERMLSLATFLGAETGEAAITFPLSPADLEAAHELLKGCERPLTGIHPAARQPTRRWSSARFAQAGARLYQKYGGTLVLLGEAQERQAAAEIIRSAGVPARNLAGCTSLPVLGAVIQQLSVLLTNDTGPAHIAYALSAPVVTVFGAGDPRRYGPWQPGPFRVLAEPVDCRPCDYQECPIGNRCLELVSVEQVVDAAGQVTRALPPGFL